MIPDWTSGVFMARVQHNGSEEEWKAFGVTFEQSGIQAISPLTMTSASYITQPEPIKDRTKGGKRAWSGWEGVMVEMARQLYVGDLKPKMQADLEKAIADYLHAKGVTKSESTIREHARPLWQAIQSEAEK